MEAVVIRDAALIRMLKVTLAPLKETDPLLNMDYQTLRSTFMEAVEASRLPRMAWKPYSIRRGGATADFLHHGSFDRTANRGRWSSVKTARIYINESIAELGNITSSPNFTSPPNITSFPKYQPKAQCRYQKPHWMQTQPRTRQLFEIL